jgi:non-canonical poly(A) RNA polymerase PAPD5/7
MSSFRPGAPSFRFGEFGEDRGDALRRGSTNNKNSNQNFTFRPQNSQPVPRFNQQLPPQQPARRSQGFNNRNSGGRGGYGANNRGRYGGQRAPRPKPQPADRPLLSSKREPTPEQMEGMNEGGAKYKALEDLSESEASMDLATSDDEEDSSASTTG